MMALILEYLGRLTSWRQDQNLFRQMFISCNTSKTFRKSILFQGGKAVA